MSAAQPQRKPTGRPREATAAEARAQYEAQREASKAQREAAMTEAFGDKEPGRWIVVASWSSTVLLLIVTVLAVVAPDTFIGAFFAVAVALFFIGCAVFVAVLGLAASRSRTHEMGIGGLFFLAGSAPRRVQWNLLGSVAAQIVISFTGAALDPFTPLAFGTLVPVLPLALCGLWSVRHGLFGERSA